MATPFTSPFIIRPGDLPSGCFIIPPYFVPPGTSSLAHGNGSLETVRVAAVSTSAVQDDTRSTVNPALSELPQLQPASLQEANRPYSLPAPYSLPQLSASRPAVIQYSHLPAERKNSSLEVGPSRSPSPPHLVEDLERQRLACWSLEARRAFQKMIEAPGYTNRYRLSPVKRERMIHYLLDPNKEPTLEDTKRDHQTRYQSANFTLHHGHLYRKPEAGSRVGTLRRHLDETGIWDVLTSEHLRSNHLGRDKLRKVLEKLYIGYTLQEVMFVLKECKLCKSNSVRRPPGGEVRCLNGTTGHGSHGPVNVNIVESASDKREDALGRALEPAIDPALKDSESGDSARRRRE